MTKVWESMNIQTYADLDEKQMQLKSSSNYLFLKANPHCILIFNPQGGFVQRIDAKEVKSISVDGSVLAYTDGVSVFIQQIELQKTQVLTEKKINKKITGIVLKDNRVYLLYEDGIRAFSILYPKE
jgi:hypothetical protein